MVFKKAQLQKICNESHREGMRGERKTAERGGDLGIMRSQFPLRSRSRSHSQFISRRQQYCILSHMLVHMWNDCVKQPYHTWFAPSRMIWLPESFIKESKPQTIRTRCDTFAAMVHIETWATTYMKTNDKLLNWLQRRRSDGFWIAELVLFPK